MHGTATAAAAAENQTSATLSEKDSATFRNWSDLPGNFLIHVLEHIDALHRHNRGVLVCKSWAGEAASVRSSHFLPGKTFEQFREWLAAQPQSSPVTYLHFTLSRAARGQSGDPWTDRQLPQLLDLQLPNLQDLQLTGPKLDTTSTSSSTDDNIYLQIQLGASDSAPGILHAAAAGLSRLVLDNVVLPKKSADSAAHCADLQVITVLTALQHLELGSIQFGPDPEDNLLSDCSVPGAIFPALSHLTHLSMHRGVRSGNTLQHISCLQRLQQLKVGLLIPISSAAAASDLSGLSTLQSLTALTIFGAWFPLSTASTPSLTSLTSLLQLHLHSLAGVDPALLRSFPKLQTLQVKKSLLHADVPAHAGGVSNQQTGTATAGRTLSGTATGTAAGSGAVAALLSAIAQLKDLFHLSLPGVLEQPAPTVSAYSALTASSSLRKLDVSRANIPAEAWGHIFAPGRALPLLTQLCLAGVDTGLAAVQFIAKACPGLQQLNLMHSSTDGSGQLAVPRSSRWSSASTCCCASWCRLDGSSSGSGSSSSTSCLTGCSSNCQPGNSCCCGACLCLPALLSPLRDLSHLMTLTGDGPAAELGVAVAQLTQLCEVTLWGHSNSVTAVEWLLALTALQQLQLCHVPSHNLKFVNKAPPNTPPDVWSQLEQHCHASSNSNARSSASASGTACLSAANAKHSSSTGTQWGEESSGSVSEPADSHTAVNAAALLLGSTTGSNDDGCTAADAVDSGSEIWSDDTSAVVSRDQDRR